MKLSVVQNVWEINPYIRETLQYNLYALEESKIDFEYIIFNDKGNKKVLDSIKDIVDNNPKVTYHYSDINYGEGKCRGGWLGSIPLIKGDIFHCVDDDDVFVKEFYQESIKAFNDPEIMFFTANALKTDESLNPKSPCLNPDMVIDYTKPLDRWKEWFGVSSEGKDPWFNHPIPKNQVTRANNMMLASGTMYRKELHDLIGNPSPKEFLGTHDFEYWSRILFHEYKGIYNQTPLWYYRISDQSISYSEKKKNIDHRPPYMEKIRRKYYDLWYNKINK
mgnify:CR=1 FL=1